MAKKTLLEMMDRIREHGVKKVGAEGRVIWRKGKTVLIEDGTGSGTMYNPDNIEKVGMTFPS